MVDDSSAKEQHEMCLGPNSDMIINLPDNVIDQILVRLPIREVVRTSVLSTKWRYKWTTITQLVFHDDQLVQQLPSSPNNNNSKDNEHIHFIDRVLLLHSGFIHKFELSNTCLPISSSMMDAWILFLSRKNIKEFVLNFYFSRWESYTLPSCFFSAQQITTLELQWCVLKPPPTTFTGFRNLKSLCLNRTTFDSVGYEYLISKCPVLERLRFYLVKSLDKLNICSPNLKYFYLFGPSSDICFENTPLLSDVFIHTSYVDVVKVLSSLPNLRKFTLGFMRSSKIPEKLPFTCHHLNILIMLHLNFENVNELCVPLCLLNSSPNLRELIIRSGPNSKSGHGIENFLEERTHNYWNMSGLQVVYIEDFKGFKVELEFIKLLLANSPMLEILSIRSSKQDILDRDGFKFLKELLIFPRASPKAKIKFLEKEEK